MKLMGVSEIAEALSVSRRRVRQMLAQGALAGQRVGRTWVVHRDAIERLEQNRSPAGRPWHPATAWALLALADGRDTDLSPVQRSRVRRRLEAGLEHHLGRLRVRAEKRRFYAHPSVIDLLGCEPSVVRSGVSAFGCYQIEVVAVDEFEGYVPASSLPSLVSRFALDEHAERPNVLLRTVDDEVWPFDEDESVAPLPVVAVDLLEAHDSRIRRAGFELLKHL